MTCAIEEKHLKKLNKYKKILKLNSGNNFIKTTLIKMKIRYGIFFSFSVFYRKTKICGIRLLHYELLG